MDCHRVALLGIVGAIAGLAQVRTRAGQVGSLTFVVSWWTPIFSPIRSRVLVRAVFVWEDRKRKRNDRKVDTCSVKYDELGRL